MRIFRSTTSDQNANTYVGPFGEIVVGDNGMLLIQNNVTPGGTALNIEPATPSVLGGVKLGEGFVLNASNQVTTSKLYSTNLTQPTQHYRLELDTNGVVILPDQSIINGSTLRAVAGSYAGLTTNDGENSWMWVDSGGAYIATEYSTTANQWTFDNNGNLTLPANGTINFSDGSNALVGGVTNLIANGSANLTISSDGTLVLSHPDEPVYHPLDTQLVIEKAAGNYHIISGAYGLSLQATPVLGGYGDLTNNNYVDIFHDGISINVNNNTWGFDLGGNILLPTGGTINFADGSNALVGGSSSGDITFTGNVIGSINGNIVIDTALVPSGNATIDLGTIDNQWRSLYVSGQTIYLAGVPLSVSDGNTLAFGNTIIAATSNVITTVTGNLTFSNTTIGTVAVNSNVNISTVYQYANNNQATYMDFNVDPGTQSVSMDPGITIGTDAFTISFWIYRRTVSEWTPVFSYLSGNSPSPFIYFDNSNNLVIDPYYFALPVTMLQYQWYYVAICRDADGNLAVWLNNQPAGPAIASAVLTNQESGPMTELAYLWYGPSYAQAPIGSVQVVIGSNIYATSGNISVPTDVPVDIPGTVLLLSTSYDTFYAFSDASNTQIITNNNSTPGYTGTPVYNVTIVNTTLAWQFAIDSEGNPQLVVPPDTAINSPTGQLSIYGAEGVYINAGSEGYIDLEVENALGLYGPENGGGINFNAGGGAEGGGGGSMYFNAGYGTGNTITQYGSEGGSIYMSGGGGAVYVSAAAISAISLATPVTITVPNNNVAYSGKIYIQNLTTATELNNASYHVIPTGSGNLQLFHDLWLQIPVVGTGISPYSAGSGNITASTDGGSLWLYGGSPSNPSYGSEGRVYVQSNLSVNSLEPFNYNSDLLLRNQNSYYNFNNQSTISNPGGTQYTPYDVNPTDNSIYWTSNSPFSNVVTSNGSINSVYNQRTNLQPPMPAIRQSAYTISLWFNSRYTGGNNPLLGGDNGSLNLISPNLTTLIVTTGDPNTATGFAFPVQLTPDQWYYLVVTRDDQHRCAAWLDGEYLVNGNAGYNDGIDINDYTNPIIYLNSGPYGSAFDGVITDVKIDNVNLYSTWSSNITVPTAPAVSGYSTQVLISATDSANVFVNSANTVVYTPFTIANGGTELGISSDGSIYLPGTRFGNVSISGTVTTVGGLYPAVALPSENVYIWYASSPDVSSFKMSVRAQHNDPSTCVELADITAALDSTGGLVYSVGNRVTSNAAATETTFGVLVDNSVVSGQQVLVVNAAVTGDTVFFTYSITEFTTSHAT